MSGGSSKPFTTTLRESNRPEVLGSKTHARLKQNGTISNVTLGEIHSRSANAGKRKLPGSRDHETAHRDLSRRATPVANGAMKPLSSSIRKIAEAPLHSQCRTGRKLG